MDTALALSIAALAISGATALIGGWQVLVLRKQVSSTQQANMYAEFRGVRWDPVEYDFLLGNGGPAIARNIRIWLEAGDTVAGAIEFPPMQKGSFLDTTVRLGQPLAYQEGIRAEVVLMASWSDDSGRRREVLVPGLPAGT